MILEELQLLMDSKENEHLEFKEAKSSFSILGDGGKNKKSVLGYCVALANEGGGKLILGVSESFPRRIVGSNALQNFGKAKSQIYKHLDLRIEEIEEIFDRQSKRVVIIHIPPRPIGKPLKFYGVPLMRVGEQLLEMDDETENRIRNEVKPDWSALVCPNSRIEDLDPEAIRIARVNFKVKNPKIAQDVDKWSDETFLNKAKLTIKSKITNTAIILLGKEESSSLISPAVCQMTWILKDADGNEKGYEHFYCPFLLSVKKLHNKIRNLKYRYIKDGSLFPEEVDMYDSYVIREALHNCIAHQDYSLHGRIQLIENEEGYLIFSNKGQFLPGSIEAVIEADAPQEYYKNRFLVNAMVNLNMIDTIGSGIKKMFTLQKERLFPMPSYDFSKDKVTVTIHGKLLDLNYARTLAHHKDLSLVEILLLDHIQKRNPISKVSAKNLRKKHLIEGRYPNLYISERVAGTTGEIAEYIKNRGFHDQHYKKLILEYLEKKPGASRQDINQLLMNMLPKILNEKQKKNKITNLLYDLSRKDRAIANKGSNRKPKWEITN